MRAWKHICPDSPPLPTTWIKEEDEHGRFNFSCTHFSIFLLHSRNVGICLMKFSLLTIIFFNPKIKNKKLLNEVQPQFVRVVSCLNNPKSKRLLWEGHLTKDSLHIKQPELEKWKANMMGRPRSCKLRGFLYMNQTWRGPSNWTFKPN